MALFRYQIVRSLAAKNASRQAFYRNLERLQAAGVYDVGEAIKCRGDMAKALGRRRKKGA